ncbi:MAG: dockerin type I repeat-containing protein, partial [Oscillospiraceae bacterium]
NQGTNALTTKINNTNGFFDVLFGIGGKGYKINQEGGTEFWVWMDTTGVTLNNLHFGFRTENVYGSEYYTYFNSDESMVAYIQNGTDSWKEVSFKNGVMTLSNYKGFIRFSAEYFVSKGGSEILWPTDLAGFLYGYDSVSDDSVGKTFTIDEIGFAGSKIEKPNLTVGNLLKGDVPSSYEVIQSEPKMKDTIYSTFADFEHELFKVGTSLGERDDKGLLVNEASKFAGSPDKEFGTYFDMTVVNRKINGKDTKAVSLESFNKEFEGKPNSGHYAELAFKSGSAINKPLQMLPKGKNIAADSESHGLMFYVDTKEYKAGSIDCQAIFKEQDYNNDGTKYITYDDDGEEIEHVTFRNFAPGGSYYIEDPSTGDFVLGGNVNNSNYINIPADYQGYIKIPFASMGLAWGSNDVNNKVDLQKFAGFSLYYGSYPTRLGPVYLDDFGFYGETFKKEAYTPGDINNDGKINTLDALNILKHIAKLDILSGTKLQAADFNIDGNVNSLDALAILKKVAKL